MVEVQIISAAALKLFAERGYRATTMADIGAAVGLRGPSLYRHVSSKQVLLGEIMVDTMKALIADQQAARDAGGDATLRLRRMVEAHVCYHAAHREQAFVGNREIDNLEQPYRDQVLGLRQTYELGLRTLIEHGCAVGEFAVSEPRLASYAILDMGIGVATWFRADGPHRAEQVAYTYADYTIRMLTGRSPEDGPDR
jgi:AcrR family transcriptional regulator